MIVCWGGPCGPQSTIENGVSEVRPVWVRQDVRDENRLPKVSSCAARPNIRTDARSIRRELVRLGQVCCGAVSQVKSIFVEQENRAQYSFAVGFDHVGDARQNFVQRFADEDYIQRL